MILFNFIFTAELSSPAWHGTASMLRDTWQSRPAAVLELLGWYHQDPTEIIRSIFSTTSLPLLGKVEFEPFKNEMTYYSLIVPTVVGELDHHSI